MLRDRFREFAHNTESIGQERVAAVNEICDQLIQAGHSDAATIAEWKDGINESWADLLELIDTRTQMLQASWELFKFYNDCKETLDRIHVRFLSLECYLLILFMNIVIVLDALYGCMAVCDGNECLKKHWCHLTNNMRQKKVQNERQMESLYFCRVIEVIMVHQLGQFWYFIHCL